MGAPSGGKYLYGIIPAYTSGLCELYKLENCEVELYNVLHDIFTILKFGNYTTNQVTKTLIL